MLARWVSSEEGECNRPRESGFPVLLRFDCEIAWRCAVLDPPSARGMRVKRDPRCGVANARVVTGWYIIRFG